MSVLTSLTDVDLSPIPGKEYFNFEREWREEFIYFAMTDRFQDSANRIATTIAGRSIGVAAGGDFYGGTIRGVTNNLAYIAGLGCTAIWLSPVLEANSYHGYDINNYLDIDPHFGTKQDLVDLVQAAHNFVKGDQPWPIRIIMDVVINHSGDNWGYPGNFSYNYSGGQQFPFGAWRRNDRPIPVELRNPDYYHRCGQIGNYEALPEYQLGDIASLKDYENDDNPIGSTVINALIMVFCYWIREADVDGFRVDAVKHMGALACSRFCSNVREYAYALGKRGFFLYGEVAEASDDLYNSYLGPNTSVQVGNDTVFIGLDSVLDFRLAEGIYQDPNNAPLPTILKAQNGPQGLFNRLELQLNRALNRGESGRYLVTFVDNHDSFWQPTGRFANGATDDQVIAAIGFILCALGTPCIYYGTEQGFSGSGGDPQMREAMFDKANNSSLLNTGCRIYQEIAKIAAVMRAEEPLRFGRMYYRQIGNGTDFGLPYGSQYTLAFSRLLYTREVLVAYNVSGASRSDSILADSTIHSAGKTLEYLYGGIGSVVVQAAPSGACYMTLPLRPYQFVILG
ncbi:alpha-amylase family glycosyl hydrolase [Tunturiibacter gelidiferens]|uniref:alpha-amylase family glycosyl hydrolase n=1 Tax=Tunturiibacter gelidiferens TaxID=3069689 RepID=UPI003D9B339E